VGRPAATSVASMPNAIPLKPIGEKFDR
jgi:hypothetical protein